MDEVYETVPNKQGGWNLTRLGSYDAQMGEHCDPQ